MIRDLKPVWRRRSNTEISATPGNLVALLRLAADVSGATVWVSEAQLRNRQKPTDEDAGKWITLSANLILDGHNCAWVMQYPHQPLAGGSMYACICLHIFAPAGSAGGAPPQPM